MSTATPQIGLAPESAAQLVAEFFDHVTVTVRRLDQGAEIEVDPTVVVVDISRLIGRGDDIPTKLRKECCDDECGESYVLLADMSMLIETILDESETLRTVARFRVCAYS